MFYVFLLILTIFVMTIAQGRRGRFFYEWQIFDWVIMWKHSKKYIFERKDMSFQRGRLYIWRDDQWLYHGAGARLMKAKKNMKALVKRLKAILDIGKLRWQVGFAEIQLKLTVRRLEQIERKLLLKQTELSMESYLLLQEAGFRISYYYSEDTEGFAMFKFFWDGQLMQHMPDIDMVETDDAITYHTRSFQGQVVTLARIEK